MSERFRHIRRDEWRMFHEKTYARQRIVFRGAETEAQLMHIGTADAPFTVPSRAGRSTIADSGWCWLQLAPKDGHWWMTAMYDPDGRPAQYYFDVTAGNRLGDGKDASFEDLYLDYVLCPDGSLAELDRDELENALASGKICQNQYDIAVLAGDALRSMLISAPMAEFDAIYAHLRAMEARTWDEL